MIMNYREALRQNESYAEEDEVWEGEAFLMKFRGRRRNDSPCCCARPRCGRWASCRPKRCSRRKWRAPAASWSCPWCCWSRCLWWCRTVGRRGRWRLSGGRVKTASNTAKEGKECLRLQEDVITPTSRCTPNTSYTRSSRHVHTPTRAHKRTHTSRLTCPQQQHGGDNEQLPCLEVRSHAQTLHRWFIWGKRKIQRCQTSLTRRRTFRFMCVQWSPEGETASVAQCTSTTVVRQATADTEWKTVESLQYWH